MASRSRWHDAARERVDKLLALPGCPHMDGARRGFLMEQRPGKFASGYPAAVWRHEVDRATGRGRPDAILFRRGWPMTPEQEAFFEE
jgi:hypothetical protein